MTFRQVNNKMGSYTGNQSKCRADRIRSVYGCEYAGGYTGFMETANTAETGSIELLGGLISVIDILTLLGAVYPTEKNTEVYGPLSNLDVDTWNKWIDYVGKYGGHGIELLTEGKILEKDKDGNIKNSEQLQNELDEKLKGYIYILNSFRTCLCRLLKFQD